MEKKSMDIMDANNFMIKIVYFYRISPFSYRYGISSKIVSFYSKKEWTIRKRKN